MLRTIFVGLLVLAACNPSPKEKAIDFNQLTEDQQHLPENAEASLTVHEGLQVTLFAAEPQLINPTNMDIDEKGRVWICEGYNYRPHLNGNNPLDPEGDKIIILEDSDGDGKADNRKVYYQGNDVNAALGICVLGNKVIVSCSPNVFVFTDLDGDDKPDQKEILFTGIGGEQNDHGVHSFLFGPDGKLYFTFGNAGGQIHDKDGNPVIDKYGIAVNGSGKPYLQGMVFRCDPDGTNFEVVGHNFRNNYEVAVDSYGTVWQSDNDDDGNQSVRINYVMEHGNFGYRDEFTGAGWRTTRTGMSDSVPFRHWHQNDPGVIPNLLQTGAGSPTGILVYEGDLLPQTFHGQMIHADAGPSIVRAYPVVEEGAGYRAELVNIVKGKSQWFRPADITVAPDGSLFIADWYDPGVGGHQMRDQQKGRIYRIAPENTGFKVPEFDLETVAGAAEALKNPNLSVRYLAWQRLNQAGAEAEAEMKKLWQSDNPVYQARILWLMASWPEKGETYIDQAINHQDSRIRIAGLRAARRYNHDLGPMLSRLARDPSSQVRREVALGLKDYSGKDAAEIWTVLANQYSNDRWYLEALGIGAEGRWDKFLAHFLQQSSSEIPESVKNDIIWRSRAEKTSELLASIIIGNTGKFEDNLRYYRAFDFQHSNRKNEFLLQIASQNTAFKDMNALYILKTLDAAKANGSAQVSRLVNQVLPQVEGTMDFVDLLKKYNITNKDTDLLQFVLTRADENVAVAAAGLLLERKKEGMLLDRLKKGQPEEAMAVMLAVGNLNNPLANEIKSDVFKDEGMSLELRRTALQLYGRGWQGENDLLTLAAKGEIPEVLVQVASGVLFNAYRKSIRDSAAYYFPMPDVRDGKPLPPIDELVAKIGDPVNGKLVYDMYCKACHQVAGEGINFGPALTQIGSKYPKNGLYVSVLQPDAGISFGYEGYTFELKDGSLIVGIIESETETNIDILQMGGIKTSIRTDQVVTRKMLERSLMPADLQKGMTESELVDLVEYLAGLQEVAS